MYLCVSECICVYLYVSVCHIRLCIKACAYVRMYVHIISLNFNKNRRCFKLTFSAQNLQQSSNSSFMKVNLLTLQSTIHYATSFYMHVRIT